MIAFASFDGYAAADDITILFNGSPSYIMDKDDAGFRVLVFSDSNGTEYTISYTIDGEEYIDTLTTSAYKREDKDIELNDLKKGIHKLDVSVIKDGVTVESASADICIIDYYEKQFMDEYSKTYMSTHFVFDYQTDSTDLDIMKKIGIAGVRDEIFWETVEWNKGVFDFQKPDGFMPELQDAGMDTCIIFDYSNRNYVTTSVDGSAATNRTAPRTAEEMKAFVEYVKKVLERYPQITRVEIWNEPNWGFWEPEPNAIDYAAMVKAVSNAVREINPDICIIAGSLVFGGNERDFLKEMFDEGVYSYVDAISSHPYTHPMGTDKIIERRLDSINSMINEYGGFKGHIATETGASTAYSENGYSEDEQASELVKTYVYGDSRDIDSTYWYTFRDNGDNPEDTEDRFGILHRDYTAKPALAALSQYTNRLNGALYCGRLDMGGDVKAFLYMADGIPVVVAWTAGENTEINIENNGVEDIYGNPTESGDTVLLTQDPIYIFAADENIYSYSAGYELGLIGFEACDSAEGAETYFNDIREESLSLIDETYNNHSISEQQMMSELDTLYSAAEKYAMLAGIYGTSVNIDEANTLLRSAEDAVYAQDGVKQYSEAVLRMAKDCTERMNEINGMPDSPSKNTALTYYCMRGSFLSELVEHIAYREQPDTNKDVLLYTSKTDLSLSSNGCELTVTAVNGGTEPIMDASLKIKDENGETITDTKIDIDSEDSATADITLPDSRKMSPGTYKMYVCLVDKDGAEMSRRGINITVPLPEGASGLYTKYMFEDASAFVEGINFYNKNGAVQFITDNPDYPAYSGKGAAYFDLRKGGFSFWDNAETTSAAGNGSELGGYFMFKLMQPLNDAEKVEAEGGKWFKLPQMVFKKDGSQGETLAYFDPDDFSVADIEPYVWYKIPLTSTGVKFTESDIVYCNIVNTTGSGIMFMIDDIILTCSKSTEPDPAPTSTPLPTQSAEPPQTSQPLPDVEISDPKFFRDGKELSYVDEGNVQCCISIKNNTSAACEIPSAMIVCVYDQSGCLAGLAMGNTDKVIAAGETTKITADISMPDLSGQGYYAKVLLWDDTNSLTPAHEAWEVNN